MKFITNFIQLVIISYVVNYSLSRVVSNMQDKSRINSTTENSCFFYFLVHNGCEFRMQRDFRLRCNYTLKAATIKS